MPCGVRSILSKLSAAIRALCSTDLLKSTASTSSSWAPEGCQALSAFLLAQLRNTRCIIALAPWSLSSSATSCLKECFVGRRFIVCLLYPTHELLFILVIVFQRNKELPHRRSKEEERA